MLPNCTQSSLVYENVCGACNPGAEEDKELKEIRQDIPTLYVGETSRSVYERSKEHWGAWRSKSEKSHIWKHQIEAHKGAAPKFYMRVVKNFKSALSRQISEAVRIRRRGGAGSILNSKAEYDRCRIPRLIVEEQDLDEIRKEEEQEISRNSEALEEQEIIWGSQRLLEREQEDREIRKTIPKIRGKSKIMKREQDDKEQRTGSRKRARYSKEPENWGEQETIVLEENLPAPNWELPPKEQVLRKRNIVQSSIKELLLKQVEAPLREPPEPLGSTRSEPVPGNNASNLCVIPNTHEAQSTDTEELPCYEVDDLVELETPNHHSNDELDRKTQLNTTPSTSEMKNLENEKATRPPESDDLPDNLPENDVTREQGMMMNIENDDLDEKCTFTRKGICNQHGTIGQKITIPSKKWTRLRGGLFGYKTTRTTRYRCSTRISNQKVHSNLRKDLTRNSQQISDYNNLSGHAMGATHKGLPENL